MYQQQIRITFFEEILTKYQNRKPSQFHQPFEYTSRSTYFDITKKKTKVSSLGYIRHIKKLYQIFFSNFG